MKCAKRPVDIRVPAELKFFVMCTWHKHYLVTFLSLKTNLMIIMKCWSHLKLRERFTPSAWQ